MISTISFEHGKTTCASEPGKFCRFLGSKKFGTIPVCMMFDKELFEHTDGPFKGWISRCSDCVVIAKEEANA